MTFVNKTAVAVSDAVMSLLQEEILSLEARPREKLRLERISKSILREVDLLNQAQIECDEVKSRKAVESIISKASRFYRILGSGR